MDFFGIGDAMKALAHVYFVTARRSGRTSRMVASLHSGDRVIFGTAKEAHRVKRMCQFQGIDIHCVVIPPNEAQFRLRDLRPQPGKTILDHGWVQDYYSQAIEAAGAELEQVQRYLSEKETIFPKVKGEDALHWHR